MAEKIYIIGAGAIGKALAVCLANAGRDAVLVRSSLDHQPDEVERTYLNLPDGSMLNAELTIITFSSIDKTDGIFVVTSKSFANKTIAEKLKNIAAHAPIVLLQNGLNIERPFVNIGFRHLYRCVLMVTSQFDSTNELRFRPVSACPVGSVTDDSIFSDLIIDRLNTTWFAFRREDNINKVVWQKATINCVFNSVCPLLEADNGVFYREPIAMEIADRIIEECVLIASRSGASLQPEKVRETLLSISHASDGQFISTLQDIRNHRPTEMDTLNLEVVAIARSFGLEEEVAITRILGELTALKSQLSR